MNELPNPFVSVVPTADEAAASSRLCQPGDGGVAANRFMLSDGAPSRSLHSGESGPSLDQSPSENRNIDELIDWDALFDATLPLEPPLFLRNAPPLEAYDLVSLLGVLAGH
jgi:hypothetical protein